MKKSKNKKRTKGFSLRKLVEYTALALLGLLMLVSVVISLVVPHLNINH